MLVRTHNVWLQRLGTGIAQKNGHSKLSIKFTDVASALRTRSDAKLDLFGGAVAYQSPTVVKFGTLRDLTRLFAQDPEQWIRVDTRMPELYPTAS